MASSLRNLIWLALATWVLVFLASSLWASPAVNLDRAIAISGPITGNNLGDVTLALVKFSSVSTDPIDIVIDSPGGSVVSGFLFVNMMEAVRAKGILLRCYVNSVAASMAFQVLTHCDERYALSRSFLLWHGVRIQSGALGNTAITAPLARSLAADLGAIDDVILDELRGVLSPLEDELIRYHFTQETLHIGANLQKLAPAFITIERSIPGVMEALTDRRVTRSQEPTIFSDSQGNKSVFAPGEIVYVFGRH